MVTSEKQPLLAQHVKSCHQPYKNTLSYRTIYYLMLLPSVFLFSSLLFYAHKRSDAPLGSTLKWETCGQLNNHKLECTRIDVPVDHFNESFSGKTFSIPLVRLLGHNTTANGGNGILLNPGGPGGSGFEFLWRRGEQLNKIIGEGFDLLSFDPRGVNGSIPQAVCFTSPEQREQNIFDQPWDIEFEAGEMFTRAENQIKACAEIMGEYGPYINTPQTAADMNTILDFIGQEKMYYWGFSYGTTLGQTYAQIFPERVSRLIIDGVSNLNDWYTTFYDQEDLVDTDNCFAGFAEHCFLAKENCALNTMENQKFETSGDLKDYIDTFLEQLDQEPIPVYLSANSYGSVTRRSIVTNGIFPSLYKPSPTWSILAKNLAQLFSGNSTSTFQAYSDSWVASIIGDETNLFVVSNDNWKSGEGAPVHGIKAIQNFTISEAKASKLVSRYQPADSYLRASWNLPKGHNFYPKYHPELPKFKTAEPILILSTTNDPVCPLISAQKAHNSFEGSGFVEQKSIGHCSVSMPSLCTAKHVQRYFYDGIIPEEGSTCEIDAEYFPSPGSSSMSVKDHLSVKDAALLSALEELAIIGITDAQRF